MSSYITQGRCRGHTFDNGGVCHVSECLYVCCFVYAFVSTFNHQKNHCVTVDTRQPWTSTIVRGPPFGSKSHRHACKKTCPMMDLGRGRG